MYLDDKIVKQVLRHINTLTNRDCRLIIREPIGINDRLTLNNIDSEELNQTYSAVYRTAEEFEKLFQVCSDFSIVHNEALYSKDLNNRQETRQNLFILKKGVNND